MGRSGRRYTCASPRRVTFVAGFGRSEAAIKSRYVAAVPSLFLQASHPFVSPQACGEMGSALSKYRRVRPRLLSDPPSTPRLPQELLDEIMDQLAADSISLRRCSTAARAFVPSCRRHLFSKVVFRSHNLPSWKTTFPDPSTSPAPYTREMHVHLAPDAPTPLAEYMPYFSNVRDLTLIGGRCESHEWTSSMGRFPVSIRSLTMKFVSVTNVQVLGIMGQLPNLDDFSLCIFKGNGFPDGVGEILKGRYGGKLELLLMDDLHAGIVRSLLEAPEGLGFKSVGAFCNAEGDFPVYADLVSACQDTLAHLDISVSAEGTPFYEILPAAHTDDSGSYHNTREERARVRPFPPPVPRASVLLFAFEFCELSLVIRCPLDRQSRKFTTLKHHHDLPLSLRPPRAPRFRDHGG